MKSLHVGQFPIGSVYTRQTKYAYFVAIIVKSIKYL